MNSFLNIKNIDEFFFNTEIIENIKKKMIKSSDLENIEEIIVIEQNSCDEFDNYDYIINLILNLGNSEYLDKYNTKYIFPLIKLLTEPKGKTFLKKLTNDNTTFGEFNRFINYEIEDNFERFNLLMIVITLKQLSRVIVNQKSDIMSGVLLITINTIKDKLIKYLKIKELEFLKKFFIRDFKKIQENINKKMIVDNINNKNKYMTILREYYLNDLEIWRNYNNLITIFYVMFLNIMELNLIPYRYNENYNLLDYITVNIYLILVVIKFTESYKKRTGKTFTELLNYKNNIIELGIDICKNINIINETNTYKIRSNEIIENVFEFTKEIYKNNLSHNQVSNVINDTYYTDFLLKYFFMSITTFSPSIIFKLKDFLTYFSLVYDVLSLITINLAEKKIYEEILNFECKDENTDNLFKENSDNLYTIEGLNHSFNTNKIFEDVNIVIPKNKWICFYGNSGCGKSTLCNILLHKLNPSNGIIKYMGEYSDYEYTNIRDSVSFVNTDPDIFNNTILYNVTYGLKELENEIVMEKVIEKINYYLDLFDLSMYKNNLDKHIDSLSTGQKQRIKIIRCILHDKDIWILDEITSNIDNELEKVILKELKRIQIEKNKSVIHITHNLENIGFSDEKMYIRNYNIYRA